MNVVQILSCKGILKMGINYKENIMLSIEMLKSKKAILFDLDGTILDDSNIWNEIYIEFVKQECNVIVSINQILKDWYEHLEKFKGNDLYKSYVIYLVKKYGNNNLNLNADSLREKLYIIANEYVCKKVKYKAYAPEVIKKFKDLGYILGLGSISDIETFKKYNYLNNNISQKMNMFEYFDKIMLYDDVINKKPNPEVYIKLIKELDINPSECLVVEDSLSGVQAGKNAGIEVLNIPDECSSKHQSEIDNIVDYKLNNLKELFEILEQI